MDRHYLVVLAGLLALPVMACEETAVETIRGRWNGEVECASETRDITLALDVNADRISGAAFTRTRDTEKEWSVTGEQQQVEKEIRCRDDSCADTPECVSKGGNRCVEGVCEGCVQQTMVFEVTITLRDEDVQIPDPTLTLQRLGESSMEGSISAFCPEDSATPPRVSLLKDST